MALVERYERVGDAERQDPWALSAFTGPWGGQGPIEVPLAEQMDESALLNLLFDRDWTMPPTLRIPNEDSLVELLAKIDGSFHPRTLVNLQVNEADGGVLIELRFKHDLSGGVPVRPLGVDLWTPEGSDAFRIRARMPATTHQLNNLRFVDWLRSEPGLSVLAGADDALGPAIRHTEVWDQVKDLKFEDAVRHVSSRIESAERSVSIFTLTIPQSIITRVAPGLLVVVLAYLLAHVRHATLISRVDGRALGTFPWLPLFPGLPSRIASHLGTWCVVGTTLVVLTWYSWDGGTDTAVALACAIAFVWLARSMFVELRRLNRAARRCRL